MQRALIVDCMRASRRTVTESVAALLAAEGMEVDPVFCRADASLLFERHEYALVFIADSGKNTPSTDVCCEFRDKSRNVRFLVETTPNRVEEWFRSGADDCIVAPFSTVELVARLRAILRRSSSPPDEPPAHRASSSRTEPPVATRLKYDLIEVDLVEQVAMVDQKRIDLTKTQFQLLIHLLQHAGRVTSQSAIREHVLRSTNVTETSNLRNHLYKLKVRLGPAGAMINTVHGVGYRLARVLVDDETSVTKK
jgi:two-component system phosphate regulon response regulator PhoB